MSLEITPAFVKQYCTCLLELKKADKEDFAIWVGITDIVVMIVITFLPVLASYGILATPGSFAHKFAIGAAIYLGLCNLFGLYFVPTFMDSVRNYMVRRKIKKILFDISFKSLPQSRPENCLLPNDMVFTIFLHLPPGRALVARRVSKQWHYVSNSPLIWKHYMQELLPESEKNKFQKELKSDPRAFVTGLYKAKKIKNKLLSLVNQTKNISFCGETTACFDYTPFKSAFTQLAHM